jgi:hypothetical protein
MKCSPNQRNMSSVKATHSQRMCEAVPISLWPLPQIGLSVIPSLKRWIFKAAFTPSKLARASQVSGMRAQTFQESYEKFAGLTWKRVATSIIVVVWNVYALPRHLTRARQAASCKRRLSDSLLLTVLSLLIWTCWVLKTCEDKWSASDPGNFTPGDRAPISTD